MFSDKHPYYPKNCSECPYSGGGLSALWANLSKRKKDCDNCNKVHGKIENSEQTEYIRKNYVRYKQLKADPNYTDVVFNKKTGAIKATHIGHISHNGAKEQRFFGNLSSSDLERCCQNELFDMRHSAILRDESKK